MADTQVNPTNLPDMGAYRAEVGKAAAAEEQAAKDLVAQTEKDADAEVQVAKDYAASEQPFTAPTPVDQINQVMSGAPWLFALTALGGAAAKINGQAMLDGLNGMSDGIIKGDQAALDQGWKTYEANYDKWKAREDQKFRIYSTLANAYGNSADAKLRAMTAAQRMTNDAMGMRLDVDDPRKIAEINAKLEEAHARTLEARTKAKAQQDAGNLMSDDRVRRLDGLLTAMSINVPGGRAGKSYWQRLKNTVDAYPDKMPEEIAELMREKKLELAADTTAVRTAGTIAGRTGVGLKEVSRFGNDVLKSAAALDRGDFVPINKLLNMKDSTIQNPALRKLKIDINEMLNAYDQVTARGGTDEKKRAAARALLTEADSLDTLRTAIPEFQRLTAEAQQAADEYIKERASGKGESGTVGGASVVIDFNDLPTRGAK